MITDQQPKWEGVTRRKQGAQPQTVRNTLTFFPSSYGSASIMYSG
ncbi:hypothetical protein SACS_1320 [Parasaccharibacter apium]|uniref:Uncharacterized protein n=1 Tax=Parasaccharibacter apium TaxID=1510841 RepID=A0A7U7G6L6_9PROT|nr:hypothetical protein SACS_1320 [Parasaccharibacter apium]